MMVSVCVGVGDGVNDGVNKVAGIGNRLSELLKRNHLSDTLLSESLENCCKERKSRIDLLNWKKKWGKIACHCRNRLSGSRSLEEKLIVVVVINCQRRLSEELRDGVGVVSKLVEKLVL